MRVLLTIGLLFVLGLCRCAGVRLTPTQRLHQAKCAACHLAPEPGADRDWIKVFGKHKQVQLSQQERDDLLRYLSGSTRDKE